MPASTQLGSWITTTSPGPTPVGRQPAAAVRAAAVDVGEGARPRVGPGTARGRPRRPAGPGRQRPSSRACRRPTTPRPGTAAPGRPRRVRSVHSAIVSPFAAERSSAGAATAVVGNGERDYHPVDGDPGADRAGRRAPGPRLPPGAGRAGRAGDRRGHVVRPGRARRAGPTTSPTRRVSSAPSGSLIDGTPHLRCYSMSSTPGRRRRAAGHGQAGARRAGVELDARPPGRRRRGRGHPARRRVPAHGPRAGGRRLRRRERHHAGVLARQGGAGHHRAAGAAALRQPRRRRDDLPPPSSTAWPPRTPSGSGSSTTTTSSGGFVDADAVRRLRRGGRATPTSTCAARGRSWTSSRTRCSPAASTPERIHIERFSPAEPILESAPAEPGDAADAADHGHDRARRPHRHRRAPPRHHDPADGPADGAVAAVLLRVGQLRDLHGPARRGHRAMKSTTPSTTTRWTRAGS